MRTKPNGAPRYGDGYLDREIEGPGRVARDVERERQVFRRRNENGGRGPICAVGALGM